MPRYYSSYFRVVFPVIPFLSWLRPAHNNKVVMTPNWNTVSEAWQSASWVRLWTPRYGKILSKVIFTRGYVYVFWRNGEEEEKGWERFFGVVSLHIYRLFVYCVCVCVCVCLRDVFAVVNGWIWRWMQLYWMKWWPVFPQCRQRRQDWERFFGVVYSFFVTYDYGVQAVLIQLTGAGSYALIHLW